MTEKLKGLPFVRSLPARHRWYLEVLALQRRSKPRDKVSPAIGHEEHDASAREKVGHHKPPRD